MGKAGGKQTRVETPKSLREFVEELRAVAKALDDAAEAMLVSGVRSVRVRNSPGAHNAMRDCLRPFAFNAGQEVAKAKPRS